jgi:hypothetical protein
MAARKGLAKNGSGCQSIKKSLYGTFINNGAIQRLEYVVIEENLPYFCATKQLHNAERSISL